MKSGKDRSCGWIILNDYLHSEVSVLLPVWSLIDIIARNSAVTKIYILAMMKNHVVERVRHNYYKSYVVVMWLSARW